MSELNAALKRCGMTWWEIRATLRVGSDIDIRVIKHGKTDKKSGDPVDVWTNFQDYGLPPPVGGDLCDHVRAFVRAPLKKKTLLN